MTGLLPADGLLVISSETFDEGRFTENDLTVFIDMTEKLLGAEPGTMDFIRSLIRRGPNDEGK